MHSKNEKLSSRDRIYAITSGLQSAGLAFAFVKFGVDPLTGGQPIWFLDQILALQKPNLSYWTVVIVAALFSIISILLSVGLVRIAGSMQSNSKKSWRMFRRCRVCRKVFSRDMQPLLWTAMLSFLGLIVLGLFEYQVRILIIAVAVVLLAALHVAQSSMQILGYKLKDLDGRIDPMAVKSQILGLFFATLLFLGGLVTVDFQKPDPVIKVLVEIEAVVNK
ncbi:hypothetical protein [Ruegeria sp. HKCCE3926]|uniref:hypothetical protein n=1 Tax=Ruegeria sp. HKCCE3926 TaxID=2794831 RepID=UPI001AE845EC|nr:hypothetical protein [Ruegeria sp. HKCCE3926]